MAVDILKLRTILVASKLQQTNPALFQTINSLLEASENINQQLTTVAATVAAGGTGGGGTGSVTHTLGPLTSGAVILGNGGDDIQASSMLSDGKNLVLPADTPPATPAAGNNVIYTSTDNGHTQPHVVDEGGTDLVLVRDNVVVVRNTSGSSITKGKAVDMFGATGSIPNIRLADNTDVTKHAEGVLLETIANNGFGLMMVSGYVQNIDTSAFSDGDVLWLSTAGGFVNATPSFPGAKFRQRVGIVVLSHATQGILAVHVGSLDVVLRTRKIGISLDNGVNPLTTGVKGAIQIDFAGTIIGWSIIADQAGSINIDVDRKASSAPPSAPAIPNTTTDKISASAPISLSAAQSAAVAAAGVSTWTTSLAQWDVIQFNVTSVGTITHATAYIEVQEPL